MHDITPFSDTNSIDKTKVIEKESVLITTWLYDFESNTRDAYKSDITKFLSAFKGKTLKDITSTHIVAFFNLHPEMAISSKARMRSAISSLYRFLIIQRYHDKNPVSGLRKMKVPSKVSRHIWDVEEISQMVLKTEKKRDKFLLRFLFITAGRISEVCNVRLNQFKKYNEEGVYNHYVIFVGKGNKTRSVWIPEDIYIEAMSYKVESKGLDVSLFRQKNSLKAISRITGWKIVKEAALRVGINGSPHWYRHSHGAESVKKGVDLRVLQQTLGHSSPSTTAIYTEVRPGNSSSKVIKI